MFSLIDDYIHYWQVNVNMAGLQTLVLRCGFVDGIFVALPVGVQMISATFYDVLYCLSKHHRW